MNREHWKAMLPIITAFVEGRTIQGRLPGIPWEDINDKHVVGFQGGEYRIKPTPKLRPWRPEEVPVGAVVRLKKLPKIRILAAVEDTGEVIDGAGAKWRPETLLQNWTLLDGSPCGVSEEVGE